MCKKVLQGLFGGGGSAPEKAATPQATYTGGKEGNVMGTIAADPSVPTKLGVVDKKRGQGVPGLGL